ncbi:hypothetical protein P3W53_12870 [Pseudomonas denitrificans (nom. rej.)]|nr:hypothetical protein [Pseudomonas denitrificans (nom. rej.)]
MGLEDREWFQKARNERLQQPKKSAAPGRATRHSNSQARSWEPSWALVIILICAAIAAAYWL